MSSALDDGDCDRCGDAGGLNAADAECAYDLLCLPCASELADQRASNQATTEEAVSA